MASQTVNAAARLRLPDLIGDRERAAADLAEQCGAHPESTTRLLRALAALEVLDDRRPGHFSLTDTGVGPGGKPCVVHATSVVSRTAAQENPPH